MSRISMYQKQIEKQKKILYPPVEIDGEKEYEVEKILNRRDVRGKLKYLVRQNRYTAEKDTWKELENLGNVIDLVGDFEKEIREEEMKRVQLRKEKRKEIKNQLAISLTKAFMGINFKKLKNLALSQEYLLSKCVIRRECGQTLARVRVSQT